MKLYIKFLLFLSIFFSFSWVYAAGVIDHFEVILGKPEAKVGEALDITISAVDKNNEIITDYTGDILVFSESDAEAEFPNDLAENSYTFIAANEWSVKFENAVRFNNAWIQDVYVYDLNNEDILWVAEVTISEDATPQDVEIKILSPENGVTLGKNNITVSGTTQKNHQVRIIVNDTQDLFTTSNEEGMFEKDLENLQEWENTIQAYVLDADSEKIGESEKIGVKINSSAPEFKSITITPTGEIEAESEITIEVVSNAGLSEVNAIIDDVITKLTEQKEGVYNGKTLAPKTEGSYGVDIILVDEFAHETREDDAATLTIIAKLDLNVAEEEEEEPIIEVIEDPVVPVPEELNLTITGIEVTELKTKSVVTWDKLNDAESYNIYKRIADDKIQLIENVLDPRFEVEITGDEIKYEEFAIKALGKTSSGETVQGDLSDMTKVKTGPELYILLALVALLLSTGIFFFRKNLSA